MTQENWKIHFFLVTNILIVADLLLWVLQNSQMKPSKIAGQFYKTQTTDQ